MQVLWIFMHDKSFKSDGSYKAINIICAISQFTYRQVSNIRRTLVGNYCWSLRCSWSITCWRCSNYIFILYLTAGFNRLGKDKCKTRQESVKFWDLVRPILEILRHVNCHGFQLAGGLLGLKGSTHWGWDNMAVISQTTLSNTFSWMKMLELRLKFHSCLFLRFQLAISQHWFG